MDGQNSIPVNKENVSATSSSLPISSQFMLWQAESRCWSFLFDSNHHQNRGPSAVGGSLEVWQLSPSKWDPRASYCRNLKLLCRPTMLQWGHYLLLRWTLQMAGRCSQAILFISVSLSVPVHLLKLSFYFFSFKTLFRHPEALFLISEAD